jgi:hypothetical protein
MPERFTETLRAASEAGWSHAVQHRFVNELNRTSSRANPRSTRPFPQSQKAAEISNAIIAAIPAMYSRWFFQARW